MSIPEKEEWEWGTEMATLEQSFTSTGDKILRHPEAIKDLQDGRNHPIVLHIMPTERCNLKCSFCSVTHRGKGEGLFPNLQLDQIKHVVNHLLPKGLKSVIISGGGEPMLYPYINDMIRWIYNRGLKIGMITNGLLLSKRMDLDCLPLLSWVRISANSYDYIPYDRDIIIPLLDPDSTLGFSYIWTKGNPKVTLPSISRILKKIQMQENSNPIRYVRLLPDCNLPSDELEKVHSFLQGFAENLGPPFFHQHKSHRTPTECHLGRVHPVLYTDGYIYPCDSVVLNMPQGKKKFNPRYALCQWDEIEQWLEKPVEGSLVNTSMCPHCVFARQNDLLRKIIWGFKLPSPPEGLEHEDFI